MACPSRRASGAESATFKRTRIIRRRTYSWQFSTALFTILTTAGRLQDQRRGGFARGGQLTQNSLFSTSVTTWTYPQETSGGQSYATDPASPASALEAMAIKNYYVVLGVPPTESASGIRA